MSTLGVVAEILREAAPRALKARQIVDIACGRLPTLSKTPETVVSRDLAVEVRDHGTCSRFLRVGRGKFLLKEALPSVFYNVNDAQVAAWMRARIVGGAIANGVIDERRIQDLKSADVASYRQFHAFSGVGSWSWALREVGWPDDVNVWTCGCPCPPSALAENEQDLWPAWFRLVSACRPAWIFGERTSLDFVRFELEGEDYEFRTLGAVSGSQTRYFVAWAKERFCEITGAPWLRELTFRDDKAVRQVSGLAACIRALLAALKEGSCREVTSTSFGLYESFEGASSP